MAVFFYIGLNDEFDAEKLAIGPLGLEYVNVMDDPRNSEKRI